MKRYIKNTLAALSIVALASSCGDFGDLNVDPEHSNSGNVNYQMVFTNAQHQALGSDWDVWRDGLIYLSQWNQHIAAGGWWWSYGLNSYSNGYAASYWGSVLGSGDRATIRDIQTVISKWKDDPANQQNYQIARIIRAYTFQRLTDLHGDIPYSEAGQPAEHPYPKYDTQKDIYMDLLKELDEAQAALGSGIASLGKQELFYNGDVAKLKKFANSLMLRVAMRLTKVDDATAKTYAAKAFANGVITSNDDNCMLMHAGGVTTNDSSEPYAKIIVHEDPGVAFINTTFLDLLKSTNDPRIPLFMCVYPTDYETKDVDPAKADNAAPALQKALPGFFSMSPSSDYSIKKYNGTEFTDEVLSDKNSANYYKKAYSQPNRSTYGDPTGPTFVCTAAQTNLLLAEAALRGYISGDAKTFYEAGVRCAMKQFSAFPSANAKALVGTYLTDAAINAYLAANPYDAAKAYEQINTQYWINCFFDEYETYANWRRSGYPVLEEKTHLQPNFSSMGNWGPGIVRRMPYPSDEVQINGANYKEALNRLGLQTEDNFNNTRVWWDKE